VQADILEHDLESAFLWANLSCLQPAQAASTAKPQRNKSHRWDLS